MLNNLFDLCLKKLSGVLLNKNRKETPKIFSKKFFKNFSERFPKHLVKIFQSNSFRNSRRKFERNFQKNLYRNFHKNIKVIRGGYRKQPKLKFTNKKRYRKNKCCRHCISICEMSIQTKKNTQVFLT